MKLKTVTLFVATMQLLALCCSIFSYVRFLPKMDAEWIVMQAIYLVSEIALVIFFFVLFARQKSE